MIKFGAWSTLLGLGAAFGLTVAIFLMRTVHNRVANRLLAGLIAFLVFKLAPYILGFAGFYDAYPWLSFAPFDLTLAVGPLLWLHVSQLTSGRLPPRAWRHFVPVALQAVYSLCLFPLPLAVKNQWNDSMHARWIDPAETLLEALSLAVYVSLAWRRERTWQAWLDAHASNGEEFRLAWLRNVVLALLVMIGVWAPYEAVSLLAKLSYYQRFPLYVGLTVLIYYLALEGWRHAETRYPIPQEFEDLKIKAAPTHASQASIDLQPACAGATMKRDWSADGQRWMKQLVDSGLWREPDLTLERLARELGTNTNYLSRALNDGLGVSFNAAVNRLRVEEMTRRLEDQSETRDLLTLAMATGFSSKTSFNRIFKSQTGQTPSQYRQGRLATGAKR